MNLIFYNNWHNGDVHFTREFIKDIILKTNFNEYFYLQNNSYKLLKDIDILKKGKTNKFCSDNNIILQINNDIYVNTWIGVGYYLEDIGVPNLKSYYTLFEHIYKKLNIKLENINNYIPEIDYNYFDIKEIDNFISNNNRNKILIDNVEGNSYQSKKIDFDSIIKEIIVSFPDFDFILTNSQNKLLFDNVFYTNDIIKTENGDLNEISFLSTFCKIIIGRSSGPYNFSIVKKNINDNNKSFICICDELNHAFWFSSVYSECEKIWINQYDKNLIIDIIKNSINRIK